MQGDDGAVAASLAERRVQVELDRPADEVWAVIGDFARPGWMKGVESWRLESDDVRIVVVGRTELVEKRIRQDDAARTMTYGLVGGVRGIRHHEATITVTSRGDGSLVTWSVVTDSTAAGPMSLHYQAILDALEQDVRRTG